MQNILVRHNYLSLVTCTCGGVFDLERGAWESRMGQGHRRPRFCSSLSPHCCLSCITLVQHLPIHFPHFTLLTPQTPWDPDICWHLYHAWCKALILQQSHGPRNRAVMDLPIECSHSTLKLLPQTPQNCFGLGQKPLRCRAQQDLSSGSGPRGITPAQTASLRMCLQHSTFS